MAVDISKLTNNVVTTNNIVTGDGIFDDLMETATAHIEAQFNKGRIKGTDYATVYLGLLQTVLGQSVQYSLQAELAEKEVELKQTQADSSYVEMLAKIDKVYGMDYTLDSEGNVIRSSIQDTGDGLMDSESEKMRAEADIAIAKVDISEKELELKTYELAEMMPLQKEQLVEQIDLLQTQDSELLLNGAKDRELKEYELNTTLPDQHDISEQQVKKLEQEAKTAYVDRVGKDKEVATMGLDSIVKDLNATPVAIYEPKYEEV